MFMRKKEGNFFILGKEKAGKRSPPAFFPAAPSPDKDGVDCKIEEQRQDNACGNSPGHQIPLDKAFCCADVLIDCVDLLAARVFLPHLLHVDILHQLVERQAKVVAQQHQPLKVGVGLRRLPF